MTALDHDATAATQRFSLNCDDLKVFTVEIEKTKILSQHTQRDKKRLLTLITLLRQKAASGVEATLKAGIMMLPTRSAVGKNTHSAQRLPYPRLAARLYYS